MDEQTATLALEALRTDDAHWFACMPAALALDKMPRGQYIGDTLLHIACSQGSWRCVIALAGISEVNALTFRQSTPLGFLSHAPMGADPIQGERNLCVAARALISHGADPEAGHPPDGDPHALIQACFFGRPLLAQTLLGVGADPCRRWEGWTCLMASAKKGSVACAHLMLPLNDPTELYQGGYHKHCGMDAERIAIHEGHLDFAGALRSIEEERSIRAAIDDGAKPSRGPGRI